MEKVKVNELKKEFSKQNNRLKCLSKNVEQRLLVNRQSSESSPSRAVLRIFPSNTCFPDEVKVKCTLLSSLGCHAGLHASVEISCPEKQQHVLIP